MSAREPLDSSRTKASPEESGLLKSAPVRKSLVVDAVGVGAERGKKFVGREIASVHARPGASPAPGTFSEAQDGARGETRTPTRNSSLRPERSASTNSATRAPPSSQELWTHGPLLRGGLI